VEPLQIVDLISRWTHVGTAIVVLGGSVFMRFVLMPAAQPLPQAEHDALRARVMGTWKKFVHAGILLFLVSGFWNFVRGMKGPITPLYHPLMGVKILLSFGVFFLASALVGRSSAFEAMRKDSRKWLAVTIALAALAAALGGAVKLFGHPSGKKEVGAEPRARESIASSDQNRGGRFSRNAEVPSAASVPR
jgi:uncharacterized membrane protein